MGSSESKPELINDIDSENGDQCLENGSAEASDRKCDVCNELEDEYNGDNEGHDKEAVKYCQQCQQCMCAQCCKYHRRFNITKHHIVNDISEVNKEERPLFERKVMPMSFLTVPNNPYDTNMGRNIVNKDIKYMYLQNKGKLVVLQSKDTSSFYLHFQQADGNLKTVPLKQSSADFGEAFISPASKQINIILCCRGSVNILDSKSSSEDPKFSRVVETPQECRCYGIVDFNNRLAILMRLNTSFTKVPVWQIQCFTYEGKLKQQICYDKNEDALFTDPKYLATNIEKNVLYVSDKGSQSIISLNIDDEILFRFKHANMQNPDGICVDDEDNIYVASGDKLIQIQKDGQESRVLLEKDTESKGSLSRVAFNFSNRTLAVAERELTTIEILSFAK